MKAPTEKQKIGKLGEDIAARFLVKRGYAIIERNFLKKTGEIDIICKKDNKLYFVEVKSVSRENIIDDSYRPEDNIHKAKIARLNRTIETYLMEKSLDNDWEIIAVIVHIDINAKTAKVKLLDDFSW